MAAQVEWSNKAAEQLDEIVEYIANDSAFHASQTATKIVQSTRSLGIFPERGAVATELKDMKVREIHVFNYRILYRFLDKKTRSESSESFMACNCSTKRWSNTEGNHVQCQRTD